MTPEEKKAAYKAKEAARRVAVKQAQRETRLERHARLVYDTDRDVTFDTEEE